MKKSIGLISLFFALTLLAHMRSFSPIPLPTNHLIDLDIDSYDENRLSEALKNGEIFTFLAKYHPVDKSDLESSYRKFARLFRLEGVENESFSNNTLKVAIVLSSKTIGRYASMISNTLTAYLLHRNRPFELELFDKESESPQALDDALRQAESYQVVIAPLTLKGVQNLCTLSLLRPVFVPTIGPHRIVCDNPFVIFGGPDYEKQIGILSRLIESETPVVTVSDKTSISQFLEDETLRIVDVDDALVLQKNNYYRNIIVEHEDLNQSTLFLHTPLLKSSLFLSQLTLEGVEPRRILSTQINFSPRLLTLTQYIDRKNMIIASSIGTVDPSLEATVSIFGEKPRYNHFEYAAMVGVEDPFVNSYGDNPLLSDAMENGLVRYNIKLFRPDLYRFIPYELSQIEEEHGPIDLLPASEENDDSVPVPYSVDQELSNDASSE